MRHYLEAVTVCVDYSDFLAETIPSNRPHLDRWIIVTSPDDHATLDLCHDHNLEVVATRDFYRGGEPFNKGRAIERGLGMLGHHDWLLHLDADIALPGDFRESLDDADLDPACIYGVDRIMVQGYDAWTRLKGRGFLRRSWHCTVSHRDFPVGTRWADTRYGYVPIGFFQTLEPRGRSSTRHPAAALSRQPPGRGPGRRQVRPPVGQARTAASSRRSWPHISSPSPPRSVPTGRAGPPPNSARRGLPHGLLNLLLDEVTHGLDRSPRRRTATPHRPARPGQPRGLATRPVQLQHHAGRIRRGGDLHGARGGVHQLPRKTLTRAIGSSNWNTPVSQAPSGSPAWSSRSQVGHSQYGSAAQSWTCGATGDTVYGYFVIGATSGKLIFAEAFSTPRTLAGGDTIQIQPVFENA